MGSILQPGVVVEREAMVAAGAVVQEGVVIKEGELWAGRPARKLRDLTTKQRAKLHYQSSEYVKVATGQAHVIELGGNVADSIREYAQRQLDGEYLLADEEEEGLLHQEPQKLAIAEKASSATAQGNAAASKGKKHPNFF